MHTMAQELVRGDRLCGKYEILRKLAHGATSTVFAAQHLRLGRLVALKILKPAYLKSQEARRRFEREARILAMFRSRHIVEVFDFDVSETDTQLLVTEYLDGRRLQEELGRGPALPCEEAVEWVRQACVGLAEVHRLAIVHRDIKPVNLMLCRQHGARVVKVIDFGVAKLSATGKPEPCITAHGHALGTPLYMAPEQIGCAKSVDTRADVWSLGAVLYHLLAGVPPFPGQTTSAVVSAVLLQDPRPLCHFRDDVDAELEAVILRALSKDRAQRFASAAELGEALDSCRGNFGSSLRRLPLGAPASEPARADAGLRRGR